MLVCYLKGHQPISDMQKKHLKCLNPSEAEQRRERKEGKMDGAQYRPFMEGLDRPAAGGRDWKLLIGGEKEVGVTHSGMGAGDWPEKHKKKNKTNRSSSGRQPMRERDWTSNHHKTPVRLAALYIPRPPELPIGSVYLQGMWT